MTPPNVLYVHSHDTGRYVQPYGYPVPTPNIQHLADQGVLFRQAFCAAPVCSGSRAALLTGQCTHATGHARPGPPRATGSRHPERHIVHVLRSAGYWSGLIGEQHVSADPADLGYDRVVDLDTTKVHDVAPAATRLIARRAQAGQPVLPLGRVLRDPSRVLRALVGSRRPVLPAAGEHRRHGDDPPRHGLVQGQRPRRSTRASAPSLNALEENDLVGNTLVILTTDHGLAFPDAKATMYDRGIGVMLLIRGPGGFERGRVFDSLVSHLDIFPTICDVAWIEPPEWLEGLSLLPLVRGERQRIAPGGLRRGHLPRRLRTPAGGSHGSVQVREAVRRPAHRPGACQRGRQPDQGRDAPVRVGRRRPARRRRSTTSGSIPARAPTGSTTRPSPTSSRI